MRILVCIKEIPNPELASSVFRIDEQRKEVIPLVGLALVTSPFDEQAIEAALRIRDSGREVPNHRHDVRTGRRQASDQAGTLHGVRTMESQIGPRDATDGQSDNRPRPFESDRAVWSVRSNTGRQAGCGLGRGNRWVRHRRVPSNSHRDICEEGGDRKAIESLSVCCRRWV